MDRETARPLMEHLRHETHALHQRAERQLLQTELMRGRLPRTHFIAYLEQLFLIHQRLECHLSTAIASHPDAAHIIRPHHDHTSYLRQDLHAFGRHPQQIQPRLATAQFLTWLDQTATQTPLALLGVHYVLEGSKNGGVFQAVKVRDAYDLAERTGTMYLDPYGDQQAQCWSQYKADMNRAILSHSVRCAIVEAAKSTFQRFIDLCQELMASGTIALDNPSPQPLDEVIAE